MATTCFQAVSSHRGRPCSSLIGRRASLASGRMTSVCKLRELESNQRPPGSEPGVTTNSNCPAMSSNPRLASLKHSVRESHPICELQRLTPRLRAGESALRESNPPRQLGRLVPEPIGQGHVLSRRKERDSNPQGSNARPASNGVPSPIGLPFRKAAVAGIEPASARLTAAHPYQHGTHRIVCFSQDGWIRTSGLLRPKQAECQTFPRPESERPAGIEPAPPAWQASALPLRHERLVGSRIVKDHQSTGRDSNPRRRRSTYGRCPGCGVLAAGRPVRLSVGLVGIEPTSSGLRDRCIALSATIPYQSARWELNPGHRPARMPVGRCVL
jgi:hypothetical protein